MFISIFFLYMNNLNLLVWGFMEIFNEILFLFLLGFILLFNNCINVVLFILFLLSMIKILELEYFFLLMWSLKLLRVLVMLGYWYCWVLGVCNLLIVFEILKVRDLFWNWRFLVGIILLRKMLIFFWIE